MRVAPLFYCLHCGVGYGYVTVVVTAWEDIFYPAFAQQFCTSAALVEVCALPSTILVNRLIE